jgi:hypothetical protein
MAQEKTKDGKGQTARVSSSRAENTNPYLRLFLRRKIVEGPDWQDVSLQKYYTIGLRR